MIAADTGTSVDDAGIPRVVWVSGVAGSKAEELEDAKEEEAVDAAPGCQLEL